MICQCRLATLRAFINGLAQVHKVEAVPATSALFSLPPRDPTRTSTARAFHASPRVSRQQQQEQSPGITSTTPKLKNRWRDLAPDELQQKIEKRDVKEQKKTSVKATKDASEPAVQKKRVPRRPTTAAQASEKDSTSTKPRAPKITYKPKPAQPAAQSVDTQQPIPQTAEEWRLQKAKLKEKFPDGWKPRKRLSPDALAGIRALNAQFPDVYTTQNLADKFEMSAEAIRRILKSKWQPDEEEDRERQERWHRRGMQIWETKAALGVKPPRKWRAEGIARDPSYHVRRKARIQRDQEWEEEEIRKYREYRESLQKAAGKVI
jgi:hypothetical protein